VARLEVEPAVLDDTARGLRRCVDVAREISDRRGRLRELVDDCGSRHFRHAAEHFIERWGYGMGLVVGDAEHLAEQLERSAAAYRRLEADISRSAE
jgi:transposase